MKIRFMVRKHELEGGRLYLTIYSPESSVHGYIELPIDKKDAEKFPVGREFVMEAV